MDLALLQGAITGLKTAADIAVGLNKLHTMTEVQGKAIELQQVILAAQSSALSAQSQQFSLVEQIRELEKEIARVKAWESQKQRYKLQAPWTGALVYSLKKSMSQGEPPHWICTQCYEDGRRSILQFGYNKNTGSAFVCSSCKGSVHYPMLGTPGEIEYSPD